MYLNIFEDINITSYQDRPYNEKQLQNLENLEQTVSLSQVYNRIVEYSAPVQDMSITFYYQKSRVVENKITLSIILK